MEQTVHKALSDAIESGDIATVDSLVQQHPGLVNHPDWTPPPIHCAILWNQPAVAELLLDRGADIEMLDPDRQTTPLRYAIMFARADLIPLLLSRGANTESIVDDGTSALELARNAANGEFAEYDDLPPADSYKRIVHLLEQAGLS